MKQFLFYLFLFLGIQNAVWGQTRMTEEELKKTGNPESVIDAYLNNKTTHHEVLIRTNPIAKYESIVVYAVSFTENNRKLFNLNFRDPHKTTRKLLKKIKPPFIPIGTDWDKVNNFVRNETIYRTLFIHEDDKPLWDGLNARRTFHNLKSEGKSMIEIDSILSSTLSEETLYYCYSEEFAGQHFDALKELVALYPGSKLSRELATYHEKKLIEEKSKYDDHYDCHPFSIEEYLEIFPNQKERFIQYMRNFLYHKEKMHFYYPKQEKFAKYLIQHTEDAEVELAYLQDATRRKRMGIIHFIYENAKHIKKEKIEEYAYASMISPYNFENHDKLKQLHLYLLLFKNGKHRKEAQQAHKKLKEYLLSDQEKHKDRLEDIYEDIFVFTKNKCDKHDYLYPSQGDIFYLSVQDSEFEHIVPVTRTEEGKDDVYISKGLFSNSSPKTYDRLSKLKKDVRDEFLKYYYGFDPPEKEDE